MRKTSKKVATPSVAGFTPTPDSYIPVLDETYDSQPDSGTIRVASTKWTRGDGVQEQIVDGDERAAVLAIASGIESYVSHRGTGTHDPKSASSTSVRIFVSAQGTRTEITHVTPPSGAELPVASEAEH